MTLQTISVTESSGYVTNGTINASLNLMLGTYAAAGDQIAVDFAPGVYSVSSTILLPSDTSVIGNGSTLQPTSGMTSNTALIANADAYSKGGYYQLTNSDNTTTDVTNNSSIQVSMGTDSSTAIIDSNISVRGMTFNVGDGAPYNIQSYWIFGSWFTNATDISVQDNTYIGGGGNHGSGPDGNALVNVVGAVVADNISVGNVNAAYDNWCGPTNVTIEDNVAYTDYSIQNGGTAGWSILLNSNPSGDPQNPGNANNDAIVDNSLSGYYVAGLDTQQNFPLLQYGVTSETNITQQGNLTSDLGVPNSGESISAITTGGIIEDNVFTGLNFSSAASLGAISEFSASYGGTTLQASAAQIDGNLLIGAANADLSNPLIQNQSTSGSTVDNADLNQTTSQGNAISSSSTGTLSGNIVSSGGTVTGSNVNPTLNISTPPTLFTSAATSAPVLGVSVTDLAAGDTLSVTLRSVFGTLGIPGVTSTTIGDEQALTLSGNITNINTDLSELNYTSNSGGWDDSIEINVTDTTSGLTSTRYVPVLIDYSGTSTNELTFLPANFMGSLEPESSISSTETLLPEPSLNGLIAIASSGNNPISMGSSVSVAFLGSGINTVQGGTGQEYIVGGAGEAIVSLAQSGTITVAGGSGSLIVTASAGSNLIEAGASNATITASAGSNTVIGGLGNMTVNGGTGPLFVTTLPEDGGSSNISLGTGNATVFALSGAAIILTQANTSNLLYTGIGTTSITSSGNDTIYGGAGPTTINAQASISDRFFGGAGSLLFTGGASGHDTIQGGTGAATVNAAAGGSYQITAGSGALSFIAGSSSTSASTVTSGAGNLSISTSGALVALTVTSVSGATPTISLPGLMNGVTVGSGLSIVSESSPGQNQNILLSDGTSLQIFDPTHVSIGEFSTGQLAFNPVSLSANISFNLGFPNSNLAPWSIIGAASGGDTISTSAPSTAVTTTGSNNAVQLSGTTATVRSGGSKDVVTGLSGLNIISVTGSNAAVVVEGGADTVYATSGSSNLDVFFAGTSAAKVDFINQSGVAASVTGGADGVSGSTTVFGGTGGGYYQGGTQGNNSLIGGSGSSATTLIGAGTNNFLSVGGSGSNALFMSASSTTAVAGSGTTTNLFQGAAAGTASIASYGSGTQSFFVGNGGGSETMAGSNASGAVNNYYFQETGPTGGSNDVIQNFSATRDNGYINPFGQNTGAVTIYSVSASGGSTTIQLNDNTTIKLLGVTLSNPNQYVGGTHF